MATNVAFNTTNMVTMVKTIFESTLGDEEVDAEQRQVNQSRHVVMVRENTLPVSNGVWLESKKYIKEVMAKSE